MSPNLKKRIHLFGGTIFILVLLAVLLGFYFFKYIPERRTVFNRNAFLELDQIEDALQVKDQAYRKAIRMILHPRIVDTNALLKFNYIFGSGVQFNKEDQIGPTRFEWNDSTRLWQFTYPVLSQKNEQIYPLYIDLETLLSPIVSNYRDIFDDYLLIRDGQAAADTGSAKNNLVVLPGGVLTAVSEKPAEDRDKQKGRIIYQWGDLTVDYLVNTDSLMKKNDGFSLVNIQDITIEGNPYKLFLYPFEIGSQRLILAGLVSDSNYRESNHKIPFSFFTVFTVLLLLLVIHLPILRIYILGANERIRDTDIRLIIGSYFIAAFFGFFVFAKLFLDKEQSVRNKAHLEILSDTITHNIYTELDSISRQLTAFDETLIGLCDKNDTIHINALTRLPLDTSTIPFLDTLFKPHIYPYLNNVFWIGETGRWSARWAFKTVLNKTPMLNAKDRQYFQDFCNHEALSIPGIKDSLAILPTLSRLEGEYVIAVAKKSKVLPYSVQLKKDSCRHMDPLLIALSSRMHSVTDVILPPGYGFSIIDEDGNILYDSKSGQPLLTNILKGVEDPGGIRQTALYRNSRYFEHLVLRSKDMALLSTPVKGMRVQLLVYFNRFRSDGFEEHLIGLSSGLIGTVILLLILSAVVNQWSKTKSRMLESRSHHFEWLHPSSNPLKQKYYLQLIRWMLLLLATYLLVWVIIEALAPRSEFSLLFISLLFPFYIALHYYELRERYYDVQENRTGINWYFSRPSLALRAMLLIIILLINCFIAFDRFSFCLATPVLSIQICWGIMIIYSTYRFRQYMEGADLTELPSNEDEVNQYEKAKSACKIPVAYVWAILTGVTLISIIPASGIFWLFFRQEMGLYQHNDQLTIGKQIDQRRAVINRWRVDYKFKLKNSADLDQLKERKLVHGIYMISGQSLPDLSRTAPAPLHYPSPGYIHLHNQFFPDDSLILAWSDTNDSVADRPWYFATDSSDPDTRPVLVYLNWKDGTNPNAFRLTSDSSASWNTAGLLAHSFSGTGPGFPIFYIVGLCFILCIAYFLTLSLTSRIFLVELQQVVGQLNYKKNRAAVLYEEHKEIQPEIRLLMIQTMLQLGTIQPATLVTHTQFFASRLPSLRSIYLFEKKLPISMLEAKMPELIKIMEPIYRPLWKKLSPHHKFLLFDFAQDGFANYKAGKDLQALMAKGLLFFDDLRLCVMTLSFQEYILQMKADADINSYLAKANTENTWKKFKSPLLIVLTVVGIFIFVTQDAIYQKITGLLTTMTSLLPLLTNMFKKPTGKTDGG